MKFAVSNIGWSSENDARLLPLLKNAGVDGIEVAPGRLFEDPKTARLDEAKSIAREFKRSGLPIFSMQALLFGQPELRLFGNENAQSEFGSYLSIIIKLAGALGCGPLVFGSAKNRLRGDLGFGEAAIRAARLLQVIGEAARGEDTLFCLEANSTGYGCDFMTILAQAAHVAGLADHPNVAVVADTGNMIMEDESPSEIVKVGQHLAHVHISAPNLCQIEPHIEYIERVISLLYDVDYGGVVTLEMRTPDADDPVAILLKNVDLIRSRIK